MRDMIERDLSDAYGDLSRPSYWFAEERLQQGMHSDVIPRLSQEFIVQDETSIGSDDVCITLFVRPVGTPEPWLWCVQLSLVGNYAVVSKMGEIGARWPIVLARSGTGEAVLLNLLRMAGMELLSYSELAERTAYRPPNADAGETYTVYNALFADSVPMHK
jgi:hypothetical protein